MGKTSIGLLFVHKCARGETQTDGKVVNISPGKIVKQFQNFTNNSVTVSK